MTQELRQLTTKYEQAKSQQKVSAEAESVMAELKKTLQGEAARLANELSKYKQAYSELWVDMKSAGKVLIQLKKQV